MITYILSPSCFCEILSSLYVMDHLWPLISQVGSEAVSCPVVCSLVSKENIIHEKVIYLCETVIKNKKCFYRANFVNLYYKYATIYLPSIDFDVTNELGIIEKNCRCNTFNWLKSTPDRSTKNSAYNRFGKTGMIFYCLVNLVNTSLVKTTLKVLCHVWGNFW